MDLRRSDLDLLGPLVAEDGRSGRFELGVGLVRHDGALYGGTGLAMSVLALQAATGREVLWASTQFVSSPRLGASIEWTTEVLASGKRSSQVAVRATSGGQLVWTTIGSTGVPSADGLTARFQTMPEVSAPDASSPRDSFISAANPDSYTNKIELFEADIADSGVDAAIWVRRHDAGPFTPAAIAFSADFVPLAVARAAGKLGAGSSLDNSMRFRGGEGPAWILLELVGDFAHGGYGHGVVRVWGEDGELLATGSQTAAMRYLWDEGDAPRLPGPQG
ncbi:MAG TPA: thioesterase family protein [Acidimicrobiales bacterium]|nr:thioesterase family protein [Acidimicrobiales bacterium]